MRPRPVAADVREGRLLNSCRAVIGLRLLPRFSCFPGA